MRRRQIRHAVDNCRTLRITINGMTHSVVVRGEAESGKWSVRVIDKDGNTIGPWFIASSRELR